MTPAKAAQRLRGQTALAQKIFHAVPSLEAWHVKQIEGELQRTNKTPPPTRNAMLGCLRCLVEAGLITEPTREHFRSKVESNTKPSAPAIKQPARTPPMTVTTLTQLPQSEPTKPTTTDLLMRIAGELVDLTDDCRQKLNKITRLASDLEDVILQIEEEHKVTAAHLEQFAALKAILNNIKAAS